MKVRQPAVAGSFYPANKQELQSSVLNYLAQAQASSLMPKAIIAPHAGYIYSGSIAATAYKALINRAAKIDRVVLLGPSHRVAFEGIATPGCEQFVTPLGVIDIDQAAIAELETVSFVKALPEAHSMEHSLEVHLPFLQCLLAGFSLLPLVVGDATAEQVAEVLDALWQGDETLIVVSSDLSHYHPYAQAQQLDQSTTAAMEQFDYHLQGEQACGCRPINGLLLAAKRKGLNITTLDVRNSGDTAGSKDRVVGYGTYAIH